MSLWYVLLFAVIPLSCDNIEDCQLNPNIEFVVMRTIHDEPVSFDSVTIAGYGRYYSFPDSAFVLWGLPLDVESNETTYNFHTDSAAYELSLGYEKDFKIYDLHCDPVIRYYNLEVIRTSFDSVVVLNTQLNSINPINIEVYLD